MSLHLTINSPEGILYDGAISKVTIPTAEGRITVLPEHMPVFSLVTKGEINVWGTDKHEERDKNKGQQNFSVPGGISLIADNTIKILIA